MCSITSIFLLGSRKILVLINGRNLLDNNLIIGTYLIVGRVKQGTTICKHSAQVGRKYKLYISRIAVYLYVIYIRDCILLSPNGPEASAYGRVTELAIFKIC